MDLKKYPNNFNYKRQYSNLKIHRKFEGGMEYLAEKEGKYFLITDESMLSEFVEKPGEFLITVIEFDDRNELKKYLLSKSLR